MSCDTVQIECKCGSKLGYQIGTGVFCVSCNRHVKSLPPEQNNVKLPEGFSFRSKA
jgi:hypothetical protein